MPNLDPYDLFLERERQGARAEERLPICDYCGQPIWGDYYFEINGDRVCDDCIIDYIHDNCRVENEGVL